MASNEELEAFIDKQGFRYFKGKELTPYWSREIGGAQNSRPPREFWDNILPALRVLDKLRGILNAPITITSSYRNERYNRAVGGERGSYHMRFKALDFQCKKGTPEDWARELHKMRAAGEFKGGIGIYSTFVHIDCRGYNSDWRG